MMCGFENPIKILLVDGGRADRFRSLRALLRMCVSVDCATSFGEARELCGLAASRSAPYRGVCTEARLPDAGPHAIFEWLGSVGAQRDPERLPAATVVVSDVIDPEVMQLAFRNGCRGWVPKPLDDLRLEHTLQRLHVFRRAATSPGPASLQHSGDRSIGG